MDSTHPLSPNGNTNGAFATRAGWFIGSASLALCMALSGGAASKLWEHEGQLNALKASHESMEKTVNRAVDSIDRRIEGQSAKLDHMMDLLQQIQQKR